MMPAMVIPEAVRVSRTVILAVTTSAKPPRPVIASVGVVREGRARLGLAEFASFEPVSSRCLKDKQFPIQGKLVRNSEGCMDG